MRKKILAIGDFHAPFHSRRAMNWAVMLAKELKPDAIVQVGDLYDQFAYSRYPKSLKLTPEQELGLARQAACRLWDMLPKTAKRYQLMGNHDDRILKRALVAAPELAHLVGKSMRELYTFDKVTTIHDPELLLEGIIFQHGHRSKLGDHAKYNQQSTVCGHSHLGGVVFMRNAVDTFWELNAGFLGDTNTEAFSYHAQRLIDKTTLGVGWIDEYGPRFIPFPT